MMTKAQNAKRIANLRATLAAKKSQRLQAQPVPSEPTTKPVAAHLLDSSHRDLLRFVYESNGKVLNVQLAFALELRKVLNRTFHDHDATVAK